MNYIILDLEWNQCPSGKKDENSALPFEIIELGAIKLDSNQKIIDQFHEQIHPQVYRNLHYRVRQLVKINMEELSHARNFPDVIQDFFVWCGKDFRFCTWGSMDLEELQRNIDYYHIPNPMPRPLFYYDVQKLFSHFYEDGKSRKALSYAVEFLHLEKKHPFHRALADSFYTAKIMQQINLSLAQEYDSIDYHRPPLSREEEIYEVCRKYAKFVSMVYDHREDLMNDHTVTSTRCYKCGRLLRKKIHWFFNGNNIYYCLAVCPNHGYMKGKIRVKKTADSRYFAIRTLKLVNSDEAEIIKTKQENLQKKHRRRHYKMLKKNRRE